MSSAEFIPAEVETVENASLLERLTDRASPILVKEVRQAMRGKYFKVTFGLTLLAATMIGLAICLNSIQHGVIDDAVGRQVFAALFGCLVIATQVLVPFSAFLSMGGEWDDNTWDLLVLSNLRPRQIVLGKVFSAAVQALLYYFAFGPFLVFAFLLQGLDLGVLFASLAGSLLLSLLLSFFSVALSCFARGKFARVGFMVLLTGALLWSAGGTGAWAAGMMFRPGMLRSTSWWEVTSVGLLVSLGLAGFFFAAACSRLAHPEENRSTGLRVMSLVLVVGGLGLASWEIGARGRNNELAIASSLAIAFLFFVSLFYSTEEPRLGLRVAVTIPRNRLLAWLALPLLPGGLRGLVFFVLSGLMVFAWTLLHPLIGTGNLPFENGQIWIPLAVLAYGTLYLGVPGGLLFRLSHQLWGRSLARVFVIVFFLASLLVPTLIGYFFEIGRWGYFEHGGNLFSVMEGLSDHRMKFGRGFALLLFVLALTLLVNLPRLIATLKEHHMAIAVRRAKPTQSETK